MPGGIVVDLTTVDSNGLIPCSKSFAAFLANWTASSGVT